MKKGIYTLLFLFLFGVFSVNGQNGKSQKQIRRDAAKVDTVYTVKERARMGRWLYDRVNEMGLSDEVREEYDAIVFSRIYDMTRLNDTDKNYSSEEIHAKFDDLTDKMNNEVKDLLTTEQYINHLENFSKLIRSVYNKFDWDDK